MRLFSVPFTLQNKIRQRHKAVKSVLNNAQGPVIASWGLPCIKWIYVLDIGQHRD